MNLKKAAQKKLRKSGGFTLVEMLIVVAIIAILVVVSIPMISGSLDEAREATDAANERAAKSAAIIAYMKDSTNKSWYYNADAGTVATSDSGIEGYNQAKKSIGGATVDKGGAIVKITISDDGSTATPTWEEENNGG